MNAAMERSISLWMQDRVLPQFPALSRDEQADVIVVGAGIAGLSIAYELGRAGRSVIVIDRGNVGLGMTARTTAHLASELDDYYHELIRVRGTDDARSYYRSQIAAIDRIEAIVRAEGIDCDFQRVDGYLVLAPGSAPDLLEREFGACRDLGVEGVEWVDSAPVPGVNSGRALRFPNQARFHPLKYLAGLVRCIERDSGRLYSNTPYVDGNEDGDAVIVRTEAGHILRGTVAIFATNSPVNNKVAVHTKQAPYRTYAIAGRVPSGSVPDALVWDTLDPYHYVRLQPDGDGSDLLIVGGEDHKSGEADDMDERFAKLEAWTREHYPSFGEVVRRWSGQVMEPVDYLPFSGRNHGDRNVYIHSGDSGQGITNGVAGSLVISGLILSGASPFADVLDPGRVSLSAAGEFVSEQADVVSNLAEHASAGEIGSLEELRPGEGAIYRTGAKKVAAYRDESGELSLRSAVCTHVGCIVHWNRFERCWDCPCHGSQFAPDGSVLNGPALRPLAEEQLQHSGA